MGERIIKIKGWQKILGLFATIIFLLLTNIQIYGQDKFSAPKRFRAKSVEHLNEMVDQWFEGEINFWDGETLYCQLSFSPLVPEGIVKIADGDLIRIATVHEVESFSFYNHDTYTDHTYYSLPLINNRPMFAELLYDDCFYAILGSRSVVAEMTNYVPGPSGGTVSRSYEYVNMSYAGAYQKSSTTRTKFIMDYRWFLVDIEKSRTYDFTLNALEDRRKAIRKFIRANKLQFETVEDYIAVVKHYENLTKRFCD